MEPIHNATHVNQTAAIATWFLSNSAPSVKHVDKFAVSSVKDVDEFGTNNHHTRKNSGNLLLSIDSLLHGDARDFLKGIMECRPSLYPSSERLFPRDAPCFQLNRKSSK
jgi:hypothetical protein